MIMFDLKCAFDSAWHQGLLFKMYKARFPIWLINITKSYLSDRSFRVKVGNKTSTQRPVRAKVPQGGVMGPTLFNIYSSDIPAFQLTKVAQVADDVAYLSTNRRAASVVKSLEDAGKAFSEYVSSWKLKLSPPKTEAVFFGGRTIYIMTKLFKFVTYKFF